MADDPLREVDTHLSTYYEQKAREAAPSTLPTRAVRNHELSEEIERVWKENRCVYGGCNVWLQLHREHFGVAWRGSRTGLPALAPANQTP